MPKVSIVIPTYNQAQYIQQALDSVFKQSYKDFELVVVDDGSTDKTREIVQSCGEKLRYIYQENSGRGAARQRGVDQACGEYIAFLDSDDQWFPEKLSKQMDYIKENAFSGLLHTRIAVINAKGIKFRKNAGLNKTYAYGMKNRFSYVSLLNKCSLFLSSAVMPKELILRVGGFRKDYQVLEDFDFVLRLARITKIELLDEALVWYREHPGNACIVASQQVARTYLSIFNEQLRKLDDSINPQEKLRAKRYIYNNLINFSDELQDKRSAYSYWQELVSIYPWGLFKIRTLKNLIKLFSSRYTQ